MRPIPIPDWLKADPGVTGTAVFAAPDGDLTSTQIPPVEAIFYKSLMDGFGDRVFPMVGVVLQLSQEDVDRITTGSRHVLLSWHGRTVPVFVVPEVLDERASENEEREA